MRMVDIRFSWHYRAGGVWLFFGEILNRLNGFCIERARGHSNKTKALTEKLLEENTK